MMHAGWTSQKHFIITVIGAVVATAVVMIVPSANGRRAAAAPPPPVIASTFDVNSTTDAPDASPGNGVCATGGTGVCTLRAAIMEANASPGTDQINIPTGVHAIQIPTLSEDADTTGDFDIHSPVVIVGTGASSVIDGGVPLPGADPTARGMDRLIEIHPTAKDVILRDLTLREGFTEEDGGAIQNWSPGFLLLERVHVLDNHAGSAGGGINNADPAFYEWAVAPLHPPQSGTVEIVGSTFSGNAAGESGAAINNSSNGTVTILAGSQIVNNPGEMIPDPAQVIDPLDPEPVELVPGPGVYEPSAGAIANQGDGDKVGTLTIADSNVADNFATQTGAGIINGGSGTLVVERTTITGNESEAAGGGLYTHGGKVTLTASTITGNIAADGGGLYNEGSVSSIGLRPSFKFTGSTVSGNTAYASGGGMYNGAESMLTITDVAFADNVAWDAGAGLLIADRVGANLTRVTLTGNTANGEGGGAWIGSERKVHVIDSVFSGNDAGVPTPGDLANPAGANIASGGGLYTENGEFLITGSTFDNNSATETGGGFMLDNHGDVNVRDSVVRNNTAGMDGGGIENSGTRVTFERVLVTENHAEFLGGGIHNSSSGIFTLLESTLSLNRAVSGGGLANAPDNDLIVRRSLILRNTAREPGMDPDGDLEDGGLGGGIFSLADGDSMVENTTISGNTAARGGGGLFHDADGPLDLDHVTIWRNAAPRGGGIGVVESDFVPDIPPKANTAVTARNSIIGGSLSGGSCDWYITSDGGNVDGMGTQDVLPTGEGAALPATTYCFLYAAPTSDITMPAGHDRRSATIALDAIADNGGPTLTHALQYGNVAIDNGVSPCPETDQRGVARPQNGKCDAGAYEFEGDPPPFDDEPPVVTLGDPIAQQDTLETMAINFSGTDNLTAPEDLTYECRYIPIEILEQPEPVAPWDPIPVEEWWVSCSSPWQVELLEAELGSYQFEVRAIDRAQNESEILTHRFEPDFEPPDTIIVEKPPLSTNSRSATFSFSGTDNFSSPQFFEYECRLDSRDPELWLECFNPTFYSNLTSGAHTLEVRAIDGAESTDPTPARYTWTVEQGDSCDTANITLTAVADGWVDEVNPVENYLFETELTVASGATTEGVGENARTLVRFALPTDASSCELESATLRLWNSSPDETRDVEAVPLAGAWAESALTWMHQPATLAGATPVSVAASSAEGYQEWDVTGHVNAMAEAGVSYGWQIRDADENDVDGSEQSYLSREMPQDPPENTLPQLVLRYGADNAPPPPPPTSAAVETTVTCGQVLTESTKLANDLSGCLGEGLIIGAPDIELDLNGHTITSGLAIIDGSEDGFFPGIRNGSHTNVVIKSSQPDGTVVGFGYGVLLGAGVTHNVIEGLTVTGNVLAGIYLFDADNGRTGNTVRNNHVDHNIETGILIDSESENSLIEDNTFIGNGMSIHVFNSHGHTIQNNTISGVVLNPLLDSDAGIVLEGSSRNLLLNNNIADTGDAGVVIHMGSHDNRVEGVGPGAPALMTRNGDAGVIITDSNRNEVINITSHQQSDGGVVLSNAHDSVVRDSDLRYNPSGVEANNTNNLLVENNDASESLQAGLEIGGGVNIVVRNNVANSTGGSGISLETGTFDELGLPVGAAVVEGNTANENGQDGITVADGGHTVRNNTAHHNFGFGIMAGEAVEPGGEPSPTANIDGGGNVASGNAEPEQCVGVVCGTGDAPPLAPPDLSAPETTILGGPDTPTSSMAAVFEFTADDGPTGTPLTGLVFECRVDPLPDPVAEPELPEPPEPPGSPPEIPEPVDGEGWVECVSPVRLAGFEQGTHHFEVRARDWADNVDLTPDTYDWEIDITVVDEGTGPDSVPPDTRISTKPANSTSTSATFAFAGTDNATPGLSLSFECSLDGADWATCTTPVTYGTVIPLPVGWHTFWVRAIDRAPTPNVDQSPAAHTWQVLATPVDTTDPETTVDSGPDPITVLTDATFTFSSDDPAATFECSFDEGATWSPCVSGSTFPLAAGEQHFWVRATDAAGNTDESPATFDWTISFAPVPTTAYCGMVVMNSIELRNDLNDCLWDGLVVGADGITIDLNGHTVDGKGIAAGIRNDGYDNVSVKNGTVIEFDHGVMLNPGTERNIIEHLALEGNQEGGVTMGLVPHPTDPILPFPAASAPTYQAGVKDNIVRHNEFLGNGVAVWLTNSTRNVEIHDNDIAASQNEGVLLERSDGNTVADNDFTAAGAAAIELIGSSDNTLTGNTVLENGSGIVLTITASDAGYLPSDDNVVQDNVIAENGGPGIEISGSSNSAVSGNQILDNAVNYSNGDGIALSFAEHTLVRGNNARDNAGGIVLESSSDNRIEDNDASESNGAGISLGSMSLNNAVVGNISSYNNGSGISVGDEVASTSGTLVEGNTTSNNTGYGIQVSKPSHIVKDNIADENGTWGIFVGDPSNGRASIDGGGNRGQDNLGPIDPITLSPLQCYNVRCDGSDAPPDPVPPDTLILEGPSSPTTSTSATFHFIGSDNVGHVTFECSLDGGTFASCTSPKSYDGLAVSPPEHTFVVRSVDISDNVDPTPASYTWDVIVVPGAPETTIETTPDITTTATSATFEFSSSEAGSTFECTLDGDTVGCASPQTYTGLTVGPHTFAVRATDPVGDVDPTPATFAWTVGSAPVPATVGCGEIIVQSTILQNDLTDCGGFGLIVGANSITIDLNGHTIDGVDLDAGILNNGFDGVTITNGAISQFNMGIQLNPGTSGNVISNVRIESNSVAGILLSDADQSGRGNTIRDNFVSANGAGIWLASNTRFTTVTNNRVTGNGGDGVLSEFASDNRIEANEIGRNGGFGVALVGGGNNTVADNVLASNNNYAITVGEELLPSNNNLITGNTVKQGPGGIIVADSSGSQILYNNINGATGPGVSLELASNTLLRGNDFAGNAGGVDVSESTNNRIEGNNASGTLGAGIAIDALSFNNQVLRNLASENGGAGIELEGSALQGSTNLIEGNIVNGNGDDGIGVFGVGQTLTGNSAQMNGGWGIYAAVGVIDGGGNFAAGNMEPGQCFGITCTIGAVPGAPETWIVDKPALVSNSRNASFTYNGFDVQTPPTEIVYECRLDTTNDLAWEDCEYPAEYLNLSPGTHTFDVRAIDQQGAGLADPTPASWTWTYVPLPAGVAPEVILDIVPEDNTMLFEAAFTFHSNEPDVTFECKVDLFGYEPCGFEGATFMSQGAFEWSFEATEVGPHTFSVRAIDFEGNVGLPATHTWSILGVVTFVTAGPGWTPPEAPGEPATGGEVFENTATIDFIANVADATFECSLDLAPFTACVPPVTYTGLTQGDHLLRIVATDIATGASQMEATEYEWSVAEFVDTNPPMVTIERAPADNSSSTIFEFVGTDAETPAGLLMYECRVDSANEGDWFECLSPFNLLDVFTYVDTQMAPGQHTFEVRARDLAEPLDPNSALEGNVSDVVSHTWTMVADNEPPGTGILSGPAATVGIGQEVLVEFFGADNATPLEALAFECAIDMAAFEPCTSPESVQGLDPGAHTFRVRAIDLAGNPDPTPTERAFTVMAAPVTTITSGPAGQIVDGVPQGAPGTTESATFVFSADQAGATFECSLDGADFTPCTSPHNTWVTETGTHEFEVRAINAELVIEDPAAVYEWAVDLSEDLTPPNTTITSAPTNPSAGDVASFAFSGSDNRTLAADMRFECALDGTAFNSCVSPQEFSDLTHGSHTLLVRAIDVADNVDPTPASYTWTVELPPVTTILSGPADITEATEATFVFQANVPNSTYTCWMDGVMEPCTSPVTYTGLAGGDHLFAVFATGPAGSIALAWEEWEWTIADTTPPITTIESGPDVTTEDNSATFVFSANEPDVTFTCSLDGAEPQACTSPKVYEFVWPGEHTFEVVAFSPAMLDAFGVPIEPMFDPVPTVYEWTIIDLVAPDTTISFGPGTPTTSLNAWFGFSSNDPFATFECNVDGTGFEGCDSLLELTDLTAGTHTVAVRAQDVAGNVDGSPAEYAWTIVTAANNTPVGTNVVVNLPVPDGTATATWLDVSVAGATTLDVLTGGPPLSGGYFLAGGSYYAYNTTADGEPASLCFPYDPVSFADSAVRLLYFDGGLWIDVTTMNDPAGTVCGLPEDIGLYVIASGSGLAPLASIISGPPLVSNSGQATFTFWSDQPGSMTLCSIDGEPFTVCTSPVTYFYLEAGDNEFQVQAVGSDGQIQLVPTLYEWEVVLGTDTTPPDTTITKGAPALTVNWIHWFEFTGVDDQTAPLEIDFQCWLDGVNIGGCSSPEDIVVTTAGEHTLEVAAIDQVGNIDPTPATHTWTTTDLSAPDTSIEAGPDSETEVTDATFEFVGEVELTGEPVTDFQCSLDNAEFVDCPSPYTVTGLTGGPHVMLVRAVTPAGTVDPTPDFLEWLIIGPADTTPPDTFIVAAPPVGNSGPDVFFGFASNEPVEEFEFSLDGGPWETTEAVLELVGLEQGAHTLLVRAIDLAEIPNVDQTPASHTWTTLGEPDTTILTGPPAVTGAFSATFTFESNQSGATFQCSVNGSPWVPCTSPFIAGPLVEEGEHDFEVRAVNQFTYLDGSQVVDMTPAEYTWAIEDVTPPDTTIVGVTFLGPFSLEEPNSLRFELTGEDNRTAWFELEFECSLDGGPWEGCEQPYHYVLLEELLGGEHTLLVRAVDDFGNADPTPAEHTFLTEGEPNTSILTGPAAQTESLDATFTFSSDQPDATFQCSLDGAEFATCTSPHTLTGVPWGEHELLVRAVSVSGVEVDQSPAEYSWESGDMTPPVVTIITGPTGSTPATIATFTFSSDDPAALFQCSLDGSALVFCESGVAYTGLLAGEHTFEVTATKPNLLVEVVPGIRTWTVLDTTAPETLPITAVPAFTTDPPQVGLGTPVTFALASNEPGSFECVVDPVSLETAAWQNCGAAPPVFHHVVDLPAGEHTLFVRAVDTSLNVDASPSSFTWTVVGPPITTISLAPTGVQGESTTITSATFVFSADQPNVTYACFLDGDPVSDCESGFVYTGFGGGEHLFEVQATNSFGLLEEQPASWTWTVNDLTPPETIIVSGPAATMTTGIATFEFSSNERDPVSFECSLDLGVTYESCGAVHEFSGLEVGGHTLHVRAIDGSLNQGDPVEHNWTIVLPETTIETAPPDATISTTAVFAFASPNFSAGPGVVVEFECSLNGGPWGSCEPTTTLELAPGPYTLEVRATSDLVDDTPASHSWTIGDTTITIAPDELTESTSATFEFTSGLEDASFECSLVLDGEPTFGACTSPQSYTALTNGEYTFLVRASDTHGNVDATPAEWEWEVGPMPSLVTITGPGPTTTETSATFVFTAPEETSPTFECSLDGGTFAPCTSPKSYNGLGLGAHTLQVRLLDPAFITEPPITTYTWTITDLTPPETTGVSGPTGTTTETTASFQFSSNEPGSFDCWLDGVAFTPCTSPVNLSAVPIGAHTFAVQARDASGNLDATPYTWNWTVSSAPVCATTTVTLQADADAWFNSGNVSENKGSDSSLKVMSKSGGNLRSVVRFPMGTVPTGCVVQSATLRMWNDSPKSGRTIQALRVTGSWTEMGVTWSNQPATTGPAAEIPSGSNKGWRTWTVTAQVTAMYTAGGGQGFLIRDKVENQNAEQQFFAREKGESIPQLVITFAPA